MASVADNKPSNRVGGYKDKFWIPRFWDGMNISAFCRLLMRNRFAVTPRRVGMAVIIATLAVFNSLMWLVQKIFLGGKIDRAEIREQPIFIIGHWRSGTTMLHEYLVLDWRHTYPDTYACFAANHFVLTGGLLPPLIRFLLPSRRPMDNMAAGWERPQEDEFALCNMGVPSPYLTMAFPNRAPQDEEYLTLEGLSPKALERWKRALLWFLKCVTVRNPKRIVLKSPAHTCRIKALLELFPDARFVHIVRDPYVIFPSTVSLWSRLYRDNGLQVPKCLGLEEHVFRTFERMYETFERHRELVKPGRFCEVHYEDLVDDPLGQMQKIYESLEIEDFDRVRPVLEEHLAGLTGYRTNKYETSPETRDEISRRWQPYIEKYGY